MYLVTDLSLITLIATALRNKVKTVTLTEKEVALLDEVTDTKVENSYVLKKNILPLETDEILEELINWIEKVSLDMLKEAGNYGAQEMSHLRIPLTKIIILIIVNNEQLNHESLKKLKYSLKNLIETDQGSQDSLILLKYINSKDFSQLARDVKASKVKFSFKLVSLTLQSNLKQAEIEYEQCNQAYLNEQMAIARHINLKKAILKFYNKSRFAKIKAKINFNSLEHNYILATFRNLADHKFVLDNVFNLVKKNSALLQLFYKINNFLKRVMFFFYYTRLENPLDFHYIMSLLHNISKLGSEYVEFIRELTISKEFGPENNKTFVTKKVEVGDLSKEFEKWKNTKEVREDLGQKQKRRRLVGVKWEERGLKSALNKKAKKIKSKKKKIILDETA